jgi:predicted small lipoprotein YifL
MSSRPALRRAVLIAGFLVLGLSACGRRGSLEPPPDPSAAQAQQGTASEGSGQGTLPSPVGTPRSKPDRGYTIPNKPFILDPLL